MRINGKRSKAHQALRVGDELEVQKPRALRILEVRALAEKRLTPPQARELYDDHSPPPPPREERVAARDRGAGRPTKRDQRMLRRMRRGPGP